MRLGKIERRYHARYIKSKIKFDAVRDGPTDDVHSMTPQILAPQTQVNRVHSFDGTV